MSSLNVPAVGRQNWTYVSLAVIDGHRVLKPTHVAYDRVIFAEPPRLESKQIEIILRNGDAEQRHFATVLPHDQNAARIPIQLGPPI